ncbi:MAG: HMA2 domain-containing protein [Thermodesulfovibrionales bacterium]
MSDRPVAQISHMMTGRLRLKIPARKGDSNYLGAVVKELATVPGIEQVSMNPDTAGILIIHKLQTGQLRENLGSSSHFRLAPLSESPAEKTGPGSLHGDVKTCFAGVNSEIERLTGRTLNVSEMAFLGLLGAGALQIGKGNLTAIPWYTAFWYALNIFLKSDTQAKS